MDNLATEICEELKKTVVFFKKIIVALLIIIVIQALVMAGCHLYHIYQWSQFDTVRVDSTSGPANYLQGDGDINNGTDSSSQTPGRQEQGSTN